MFINITFFIVAFIILQLLRWYVRNRTFPVLSIAEGGKTTICDIDFFRKQPCANDMGRMWGSSKFQSLEEYEFCADVDETTNVYCAGAFAFALFGNYKCTCEDWQLPEEAFAVAKKQQAMIGMSVIKV